MIVYNYSKRGESPKLKGRETQDGRISLFLEFYAPASRKRWTQPLRLFLPSDPKTAAERAESRRIMAAARRLQYTAEDGGRAKPRKASPSQWLQEYYVNYDCKDKAVMRAAIEQWDVYATTVRGGVSELTPAIVKGYCDHLRRHYNGSSAASIFARYKKACKWAQGAGYMDVNPCEGIRIPSDNSLTKAVLSASEISQLLTVGCSDEIRRAYMLSLLTGIRFCDIIRLRYSDVDYSNSTIAFTQVKTAGRSAHARVNAPLSPLAIEMIGRPRSGAENGLIFTNLPTFPTCLTHIRQWAQAAGIKKRITWHSARHSFASNLLAAGADIATVSNLLGHSGVAVTQRYTHAFSPLKRAAVESLEERINLNNDKNENGNETGIEEGTECRVIPLPRRNGGCEVVADGLGGCVSRYYAAAPAQPCAVGGY